MDENAFQRFVKKICEYCMKNYVIPYLKEHGVVMSYRAQVGSVDSENGKMTVQKPFDEAVTLPYTASASALTEGKQCVVFMLGDSSNAVVVSDGKLSTL